MPTMTLSPRMRTTLDAVVARPGRLRDAYHARTIYALAERGLVRAEAVDTAGVTGEAIYPTLAGYDVIHGERTPKW